MSLVPALAEAHAARIERLKRMGAYKPSFVSLSAVGRHQAPILPVNDDTWKPVDSVDIPNFLALRQKRRDWIDLTSKAALKPADSTIVLRLVVERFGVSKRDLISERRTASVVKPRMVACWLMRHVTTLSLPSIGKKLGHRDHTTVLHAVRKIDFDRERDADLKAITDELAAQAEREIGACED